MGTSRGEGGGVEGIVYVCFILGIRLTIKNTLDSMAFFGLEGAAVGGGARP